VQPGPGIHFRAPCQFELGAEFRIFHVLKTGEPVGDRAHVAATLNIILATKGIDATAITANVSGEQSEVDERLDVVHGVVVFGDAQGPAHLCARRFCVGTGGFADQRPGHAGFPFGSLERVFFDRGAIGFEPAGGVLDKFLMGQAGMNNFAGHGVGQSYVGADVQAKPGVRKLRGGCAPGVNHDKLRAAPRGLQQMMKENRMRFAGIGAPEKNKVRLRHFLIGTGGTARAEDRRQTGDAGGVSSPVTTVNVVAADDRADKFLRDVIQFVGCFRATEHAESARPVLFDLAAQLVGGEIKGFLPACRPVALRFANQRSGEPGGGDRRHLKLPPECAAESLGLRNRTKVVALGRPATNGPRSTLMVSGNTGRRQPFPKRNVPRPGEGEIRIPSRVILSPHKKSKLRRSRCCTKMNARQGLVAQRLEQRTHNGNSVIEKNGVPNVCNGLTVRRAPSFPVIPGRTTQKQRKKKLLNERERRTPRWLPMRSVQDTIIGFEIMAMVWIHPALYETFFVTNCEQIAGDANP